MTAPGSTAAFDAVYRTEYGRLLRYFYRKVGWDEAPDLVQETFARLHGSGALERLDNPQAYLTRIARNLLIDRVRQRQRQSGIFYPLDEGRDAPLPPEQTWRLEEADLMHIYRQALRAMPRKTRRIFLMHRLRHLTYREIAEQLGISIATVEHHMMRALARCRRAIAAR